MEERSAGIEASDPAYSPLKIVADIAGGVGSKASTNYLKN
jgi:hypothetical protein